MLAFALRIYPHRFRLQHQYLKHPFYLPRHAQHKPILDKLSHEWVYTNTFSAKTFNWSIASLNFLSINLYNWSSAVQIFFHFLFYSIIFPRNVTVITMFNLQPIILHRNIPCVEMLLVWPQRYIAFILTVKILVQYRKGLLCKHFHSLAYISSISCYAGLKNVWKAQCYFIIVITITVSKY